MKRKNSKLINLVLSALFISIGIILPMITVNIPKIGNMLLPMHLPVLLCGLICGPVFGGIVGLVTPILRSFIFGMPPLMPNAIVMSVELLTYGFVIGLLYKNFKKKGYFYVLFSLIIAMIIGRVVWGVSKYFLLGINGTTFTINEFIAGAITTAIPGIIFQLLFIPVFITFLRKINLLK